ncbi:hypothetical protein M9H77_16773 [Catharanthus roseus]|uniref:Uncharacterized protein n=1 Tax=Catharanthus roseus TaxID=4058 RepID=A0ACC0B2N8_CATRO|nr:hypothetical protein M9H77_16773 [Catharanthus roseus]
MRQFPRNHHILALCDTRLDLHRIHLRGNDHTYWWMHHASHIEVWHQWRLHIKDGPVLAVEDLSSPRDEYIRWYRDITRVYIGNPTNHDTRTVEYQPTGVDRRMIEVDEMPSMVIQEPPSSPSQIASFAKKVQNYSEVHGFYWRYVGLHSILARYSTDISSAAIASLSLGARTRSWCSWG